MMRRNAAAVAEHEDGDEEFYESLDRILSSSCSSTSASDDELDSRRRRFLPLPLPSLDLWSSEPGSVAERRVLLLQRLGLSGDQSSHDDAASSAAAGGGYGIVRSRSGGSVDPLSVSNSDSYHRPYQHHQQRSINLPVSDKPPLFSRSRLEVSEGDGGGDLWEDGDPRCLIKDLDNGREFVVNEFGKDGMGNRLREVGTGRQLTMDEFEVRAGRSPIVQELLRRQSVEEVGPRISSSSSGSGGGLQTDGAAKGGTRSKKKGSWLKSVRNAAGAAIGGGNYQERRSSDEKDTSSERGGRRSSSSTDNSQDGAHGLDPPIKVRQYGKSHKELTGLYMSQAIRAHIGSIWSIKFSLDGQYLASAGEDCVIHVWEVSEIATKGDLLKTADESGCFNPFAMAIGNCATDAKSMFASAEGNHWEQKRRAKIPGSRRSVSSDPLIMPEQVFSLSEKPVCSFRGHSDDVLDLSWSQSQYLLSSSMDKTVRLWHMSSNSCLKTFTHSDYVTCIQFNPIDDRYFISGSLDEKVRIWSIPDRQVVDWNDLHEMVTAACYTPDGQGALVGSHRGSFHLYDTSNNKLLQKCHIDLEKKKKKSRQKKITGFQFAPGSSSKVLVTSAGSRVRLIESNELVHKFKGFRNTSSQISAYWTANGKYVVCASEDSHVYVWRYDEDPQPRSKTAATVVQSYEYFHCQGVTLAVPWPSSGMEIVRNRSNMQHESSSMLLEAHGGQHLPFPGYQNNLCGQNNGVHSPNQNYFNDRVSATWPEELMVNKQNLRVNSDGVRAQMPEQSRSAWGLVIVTASRCGEIRTFQNYGIPFQT